MPQERRSQGNSLAPQGGFESRTPSVHRLSPITVDEIVDAESSLSQQDSTELNKSGGSAENVSS